MDPSFLLRSPLLSDAENNNLMAAAAAAEKARAMMMFSGLRGPAPPGPPPGFFPGQPGPGFFPGAALAAALAAASSSGSNGPAPPRMGSSPSNLPHIAASPPSPSQPGLPQMYQNSAPSQALLSQWNAVHQAAAAHQAAFAAAVSAAQGKANFPSQSSPPLLPVTSSASSTSPVLRHAPIGFQRFSPYVIPPLKRGSPSPTPPSDMRRSSPLSSSSTTPPASPPRS